MYNPILYSNSNILQRRDAKYLTDNYFKYIKWLPNGGDVSLDIGCGDGGVTHEFFLNNMPNSIETIVATDLSSEMIQHAAISHQHSKIQFQQLDIGVKTLPKHFIEKFDHVFSSYCLHWLHDQRKTFQNIYDVLKPNGDLLVSYLANHPFYSLFETVSKFEKWKSYMTDCNIRIPPYQKCSNTEEVHKQILESIGFDVKICKCEKRTFLYKDLMSWRKTIESVNPFINRIPESSRKEYIDDYMAESQKFGLILENNTVNTPYELLIVYAKKRI
ncbi:juvenile hormone acid O-methyltransferase-like [Chrysoperla carnea]|uniref:juvenile hormone acid O-methyltransferase-like n=1 Tax=Chrysoperla carnea TaxID=189513 RepID=UPI001D0927F9|nr:juvenile hormone acid O-methyltransferase-like [Chrysoperla carnea]